MAGQIFAAVRTVILGYRSSVEDQQNQSRLMTAMTAQVRFTSKILRLRTVFGPQSRLMTATKR